jgi:gamma-glutamyl-gamma-aminobutyrate hydrolase PuuD
MRKVLVVNEWGDEGKFFRDLDMEVTEDMNLLFTDPNSICAMVFTGGPDISPDLYNHKNMASSVNTKRDQIEVYYFNEAMKLGIPVAGICRGAQLFCAMAGGSLIQDVTCHAGGDHDIVTNDGEIFKVTSAHHQMQYLGDLAEGEDYTLLSKGAETRSRHYIHNGSKIKAEEAEEIMTIEPDAVYYHKIKALGVQYHPEWMSPNSRGYTYFLELINEYVLPEIKKAKNSVSVGS